MRKYAVVLGAGGFIGNHLVNRLKQEGFFVRGVDLKHPEFSISTADEFMIADLRDSEQVGSALSSGFDQAYQLAADMGGAGYIFTGKSDSAIMTNSALINLNVAEACVRYAIPRIFYSSSACIYPEHSQRDSRNPDCSEESAYPSQPDSEYGWEKLFSERLYQAYARNHGLEVRIARLHNVFGPLGTWRGGREKAPAALCRKVAEAGHGDFIEVWGDGSQTRSFLCIEECLEGIRKLMESSFEGPVNIGSDEMVSINELARMVIEISGKSLEIRNTPGPQGVRGRRSDNRLIESRLGWKPTRKLRDGITLLYRWIESQVQECNRTVLREYQSSELAGWA